VAILMSAAYLDLRVKLDPATRAAKVDFEIRNHSSETWKAAEGFAVGYHLFDRETGTLIVDGTRVHPARDLAPGEQARFHFDLDLPAEDGRYRVIFSAMREGVCWYYERGWPFLMVETEIRDGVARLESVRVSTQPQLRRAQAVRAMGRALTYPVLTVWRNRGLIRVMVRRDILGRYRGSFGGSFWTIVNPLLLMLTYFLVFGVILQRQGESKTDFALYFLAGMLPWLAFSEAVGRSPGVMLEHRNFVKKLVFAIETLPVNLVVSGLVSEAFAVALYCVFLLSLRHGLPASIVWLPALIIPQVLFTAGICWFLAGLGVFVRDLGQIMSYIITIWFFITPICYSEDPLRAHAPLLAKNPITVLVRGYRAVFLENHHPQFGPLWKLWLLGAVVAVLGHAWFYKLRKSFPDVI
jgi:lipopolysaccharide transport system permease protein